MTATNSQIVAQQASYSRLEDEGPVEPFSSWCKRKMRSPVYVISLLGLVGGLIALAALHPWDPPPKTQYTLAVDTNYFGYQQFLLPPYLLRFTGFARLDSTNGTETADLDMQFELKPFLNGTLTVFHCLGEPYTVTSTNDSHSILHLTNAKKKDNCLDNFVKEFVEELGPLIEKMLPIPALAPIAEAILDKVLIVNVDPDLDFDRYNNSVHMKMTIEGLIKVNTRMAANAKTPLPTRAPTKAPTPPTPAPTTPPPTTASPTTKAPASPTAQTTPYPTTKKTLAPAVAPTGPMGVYEGSKEVDGFVKVNVKLDFVSDDAVDFGLTAGPLATVDCKNEPFSLDSSTGALTLTDHESSDCLQEAMTKHNLKLDSIVYTRSTNTLKLAASALGQTLEVDLTHQD